jgi:hypothetical protein
MKLASVIRNYRKFLTGSLKLTQEQVEAKIQELIASAAQQPVSQ